MNLKCPWCGATGTDEKPYPETPSTEGEQNYAFEVRGNYGHRPIRKCLNCGNGVRVTLFPPRFRKVPPDAWVDLQRRWELFKAEQERHFARLEEERQQRT